MIALVLLFAGLLAGVAAGLALARVRRARALRRGPSVRRIALPFTGETLSEPALSAALRLARAERATLMPVYLALVPMRLSADVALPGEAEDAMTLLEAIEQRATRAEVPVDSRIERGRTLRHALRELIAHERFERMVVAARADRQNGAAPRGGFAPEDVAWLFEHAPGELLALRAAAGDGEEAAGSRGH